MIELIRELTPLNRVFCSDEYDQAVSALCRLLPFEVIEYGEDEELNGWKIPPRWNPVEAKIRKNGKLIYDGMSHTLGVIALSSAFSGTVDRDELRRHLYYDDRDPDAIPFHFRQQYRSWDRDWGFCVPKRLYDALEPGEYEVVIRTDEAAGSLKLLEYTHPGKLPHTVVLMSHLDHPGMANDGVSGCAVGVEVMRRLRGRKTKYSYSLFLHQEVIGSEYYLGKMEPKRRELMLEGLFLEMLGSQTELGLQNAPGTETNIETALAAALERSELPHRRGEYGDVVVNGEYIWHTYGIPVASLSRFPYPEYHSDHDDADIISAERLEEAVELVMQAIEELESSPVVVKQFSGNICTSNPKYDLYVDPGRVELGTEVKDEEVLKLRRLMELIPQLHRPVSVRRLARELELGEDPVLQYLRKWRDNDLVTLVEISDGDVAT